MTNAEAQIIEKTTGSADLKKSVVHPEWSNNATIYEVNLRQYTREGTIRAVESHLPRLRELGVKILWFMPIHPIGQKNRKGKLGSYYAVKDYKAVNPEFGTLDAFRALVKKAHAMGFKVILDWVANHTAWDSVLTEQHPDWYTRDKKGGFRPPVEDWTDVIDLNYDQPELWDYQIEAMKFWIETCDVDGFRCDVAEMVPTRFWNRARRELDEIKPVFMLAEAETQELHEEAFDMTYNWNLYYLMNAIAKGKKSAADVRRYLKKEQTTFADGSYRMNFTSNHDENSWNGTVQERLGDATKTLAVLSATLPGMPLVYSGQEVGLDKQLKFFDQDLIHWRESEITPIYQRLLTLHRDEQALWNGDSGGRVVTVSTSDDKSVFAFIREKIDSRIFAIFNLTNQQQNITLQGKELYQGQYRDCFSGNAESIEAGQSFDLTAWGWRLFVK